jgi:hypothetical protein
MEKGLCKRGIIHLPGLLWCLGFSFDGQLPGRLVCFSRIFDRPAGPIKGALLKPEKENTNVLL